VKAIPFWCDAHRRPGLAGRVIEMPERLWKNPRDASKFFLTIPITSYTIALPASLRSDHLIGINRNADRDHAGTLIAFTGICSKRDRFPTLNWREGVRASGGWHPTMSALFASTRKHAVTSREGFFGTCGVAGVPCADRRR
jgi:hypothetical protein